jgi:hypothetical protein
MFKILIVMIVFFAQIVTASSFVTLSGDVLSGGSLLDSSQDDVERSMQFESAANFRVGISPADNISSTIELGIGQENATGFDSGVSLRRFNITYLPKQYDYLKLSIGSLTVPFGQFSDDQTNNANIRSRFFINDLGYDYLSNPFQVSASNKHTVKDFGASGLLTTATLDNNLGVVDVFVFNHSADHFNNKGTSFGLSTRYVNSSLIGNTQIGVSGLILDDSELEGEETAMDGKLTSMMLDVKTIVSEVEFGAYYTYVHVKDDSNLSKNSLSVFMGYASKQFDKFTASYKYSYFAPEGFDGKKKNVNSGIVAPNLLALEGQAGNIDVSRHQISGIFNLEENLNWHNELVIDIYSLNKQDKKDVGAFSYISLSF